MWFASLSSNTIPLLQGKHLRGSAMRFSRCSQLIRSLIGPLESLVTSTRFILNSSSKFTRSAWSVSPQTFFWLVTQPSYNQVDRVWFVNTLTSIAHNGSPKICTWVTADTCDQGDLSFIIKLFAVVSLTSQGHSMKSKSGLYSVQGNNC